MVKNAALNALIYTIDAKNKPINASVGLNMSKYSDVPFAQFLHCRYLCIHFLHLPLVVSSSAGFVLLLFDRLSVRIGSGFEAFLMFREFSSIIVRKSSSVRGDFCNYESILLKSV